MVLVNFHMSVFCLQLHNCVSKSSLCLAFSLVVICQLINQRYFTLWNGNHLHVHGQYTLYETYLTETD